MSIKNGYAAPVARVFNASGTEVFERVVAFVYMHSEKASDSCRMTIETGDISLVDHPDLQEGQQLKVVFGYLSENITRSHLVWIWDTQVHFGDNYIRIEIVAYCKAAYMKLNSSKETFNNASLDNVLDKMASDYGLDKKDKVNETGDDPFSHNYNGQTNNITQFNNGQFTKVTAARDATAYPLSVHKPGTLRSSQPYIEMALEPLMSIPAIRIIESILNPAESIPQAGASDAKQVERMVNNSGVPNLLVEGRDADLIIKKRNLLQKAYKSYTYRSEPGYLLEFTPAIRNTEHRKAATGSTTGGWDEIGQKFFTGLVDSTNSGEPILSDFTEVMNRKNKDNPEESSPTYSETTADGKEISKERSSEKLESGKEWLYNQYYGVRDKPEIIDFSGKIKTQVPVDQVRKTFPIGTPQLFAKENLPSVETTKKDAAGKAIARQAKAEMEINESTARILGDPELESGKIITIMNVGKKYSGNYYIVSAEHTIGPAGYIVNLTIFRNGKKKLAEGEALVHVDYVGREYNSEPCLPNDGTPQLANVPLKKD